MEYTLPKLISVITEDIHVSHVGSACASAGTYLSFPFTETGYLIITLTGGELSATIDGSSFSLKEHQGAILPVSDMRSLLAAKDTDCLYLIGTGRLVEKMAAETIQYGGYILPNSGYFLDLELQKLMNFCDNDPKLYKEKILTVAFGIFTNIYCKTEIPKQIQYPALVEDTIHIIRDEFAYLYGVEELAERLYVTKNHLIRVFTAHMGISPGRYLTQVRIENAKLMLQSGESSLELISTSCGFSGANYFCKVFRKETGMSTSEFMKTAPRIEHVPIPHEIYL